MSFTPRGQHGAKKLLFLGSSCIYPRLAPQPIKEEYLLTGPLETTNEAYAIAKIAGLKLAAAYQAQYGFSAISLMPTNLYGPGDNFDLESSHVLPAMIRRFHEAKISGAPSVTLWGTGTPRREFLHVDDLANAACFLMENYDAPDLLNVGVGEDLTIAELAALVARVVGYTGRIVFDPSRPGWNTAQVARRLSHPRSRVARPDPARAGDCFHVRVVHCARIRRYLCVREVRQGTRFGRSLCSIFLDITQEIIEESV